MLEVLLTTEGTYPYNRGGVATWCETLVHRSESVRYHIMAVVANPFVPMRYRVPAHVMSVTPIPLWGTEEPSEHLDLSLTVMYERKAVTTADVVRSQFLPLFDRFLHQLWSPEPDGRESAELFWAMYRLFAQYDYLLLFKSKAVWNRFKEVALSSPLPGSQGAPTMRDLLQGLGWVYRFLTVLNTPVPRVDVAHASAAAFCALPAIISKLEYGTPMVLTEHGVYLREQYLSVGKSDMTSFAKAFLLGLTGVVSRAALWASDQVSPVAAYNTRWEARLGVPERKFHVIYNGVDPAVFTHQARPKDAPLTVVSVARIDPIKDLETLMRAAVQVRKEMPDVRFVVYGSVSVHSYYERMLKVHNELGLGEAFRFAGHVGTPATAYQSGDVVALSSISEGFPYAVVEAMMSGRTVVSTDVGGTSEALGSTGRLVPPKDPEAMAAALLELLRDPGLRARLSEEARERALTLFTVQRQVELYRKSYERLAQKFRAVHSIDSALHIELQRAEATALLGDWRRAINHLQIALDSDPGALGAPLVMVRLAQMYLSLGELEQAMLYGERAEAAAYWLYGQTA